MSSPRMKIRCPNCRKDGNARAELVNRRVSCKHCAHVFRAVPIDGEAPTMVEPKARIAPVVSAGEPVEAAAGAFSRGRIEALEQEVRRLRDDLETETARLQPLRDRLDRALEASGRGEAREAALGGEIARLREQLDQTDLEAPAGAGASDSRDRLREEELKLLRDQLDKARVEVEAESRKRREAAASLVAREAEHAEVVRGLEDRLDRLSTESRAIEARRLAADSARTEAENRQADEVQALRDQLDRAGGELSVARETLETLRAERDQLARELDSRRAEIAEAGRSADEHRRAADALRSERDWLEASRAAELAGLREELQAASAGRADLDALRLERDDALARLDAATREVETLHALAADGPGLSVDWGTASTEMEVPSADLPTDAEVPAVARELATLFDDGPGLVDDDPEATLVGQPRSGGFFGVDRDDREPDRDRDRLAADREAEATRLRRAAEAEAGRLRVELDRVRAEVDAASLRNLELVNRIRALEAAERSAHAAPTPNSAPGTAPVVDPAEVEAERKRAVDEAVKGAWADFERRLAETQAKLRAANSRADLMEIEAREARQRLEADSGDGSSFDGPHSMTSIRILDARGTARLTPADAESRLALAKQVAVDRKDKPLIDRIGKMAEKVKADLEARNYTLAETLVRGAEIEAGLDPGGYSIGGLRIFRPSPTIVGSLAALAPAFDRVMRQGDLATIRSTLEEMRTLLGDQAGLPEIRRVGRIPGVKRPIAPAEAIRLFLAALEAENWLIRPIAAKKLPPETALPTYACLAEACTSARGPAEAHAPDRLAWLDSVIQASCSMILRRQQPDGHFAFLDPRGRPSKPASVVEAMVAQRPDSVKDGWVVRADPLGIAQAETGACGVALAEAGRALRQPEWSKAALKAADWAADQPCLPNFVANAASAGLLARAWLDSGQDRHLSALARKLTLGVFPGQVENGRWIDAASATTPNHLTILRALHDAWEAIPAARDDLRRELKPAIDRANSSLLAECQALGVPPQGHALRELIRHRDLPGLEVDSRLDPAILDAATIIQELCHDGPKPKLGVAPDQLAALSRA